MYRDDCSSAIGALPFDDADGSQTCDLVRQACSVDHVDDEVHILVGVGLFFIQSFAAACPRENAVAPQFAVDLPALCVFHGRMAAEHASGTVAGVPKVCCMLPGCPTRIQLARPMSPGINTG